MYYREILIKAMLYRHQNRRLEQQSKINDLEGKSTFSHLLFDRGAQKHIGEEKTSSKKQC